MRARSPTSLLLLAATLTPLVFVACGGRTLATPGDAGPIATGIAGDDAGVSSPPSFVDGSVPDAPRASPSDASASSADGPAGATASPCPAVAPSGVAACSGFGGNCVYPTDGSCQSEVCNCAETGFWYCLEEDCSPPVPPDVALDAPIAPPSGPGATFVVEGSELQGRYSMEGAGCGGTGVYDLSSDDYQGEITLEEVGTLPMMGATANLKVTLQLGTTDDGTYPAAGNGECTITFTSGTWLYVDSEFACTGLQGIGSGQPFSMSGYLNCH